MRFSFKNSVVGGTFDHFHKGHKKLLDTAFSQSENITIGISTEELYKHKFLSKTIEHFQTRETSVRQYLEQNNLKERASIISIDNIYGTTLENSNIDAIFITEENKEAAQLINEKRAEKGFSLLHIITVPFVMAKDSQAISSERIRKGEIDRNGNVYAEKFENRSLVLPENLRNDLRSPIGEVKNNIEEIVPLLADVSMVIAVGDIVTLLLTQQGQQPDLSIIDFKTRRHELKAAEKELLETVNKASFICTNRAGKIEHEAVECIQSALQSIFQTGQKQTIQISGEEDLLTLPTILLAPLGSIVIYGQYDEGAVVVSVTEEKKHEIAALVKQFTQE